MTESNIWSEARLEPGREQSDENDRLGHRTKFEQDFDRILFSTPVRRLSDKTQVFPLDTNDGVRTRLTHSHEVANIARSIGMKIHRLDSKVFDGAKINGTVLPILGAIGLAHDLGNPPFGHQGEAAIANWFDQNKDWIFDRKSKEGKANIDPVSSNLRREFLKFDGNPQSLRLLTRLQTSYGKVGLDLTAATIIASIKYPIESRGEDDKNPILKKHGYFASEKPIVNWAREQTGIKEGQRHPLTWVMEAADDIAYSVLDVEDAMKKGILSPEDLLNILGCDDEIRESDVFSKKIQPKFLLADQSGRRPEIIRDIKIGYARSYLIGALINHASSFFIEKRGDIFGYKDVEPIMDCSGLCEKLKEIARQYAFGNSEVLFEEAKGRKAIEKLLDYVWEAISDRKEPDDIMSKRLGAKSKFVFSLLSPNYLEEASTAKDNVPVCAQTLRYRELRLLTDMISGMTDGFSIATYEKIQLAR